MKTANEITPSGLFHPGLVLDEEISYRGLSKKDVAAKMEILPAVLSEIISGKRNISTLTAIKLEQVLGIDALFFLNMQTRYQYFTLKKKLAGRTAAKPKSRPRRKKLSR